MKSYPNITTRKNSTNLVLKKTTFTNISWENAKWKCQERGSSLAVISSKNQNNALREFLRKGYVGKKPPYSTRIQTDVPRWMGGQYDWNSARWKWIYNGKIIPWHQFDGPVNTKNLAWHCLIMDPKNNYRWNASICFDKNYYICQTRLVNRKADEAANLTAEKGPHNSDQKNYNNGGLNSTEQHDTQPGYQFVIDADIPPQKPKKPRKKFICPKDQILAGRKCYSFSKDKETWSNAYYKCQDMKSELAIFNNTKQDQRLRTKLNRLQSKPEKRWIGGYYDFVNSLWKWAASGRILPVQPVVLTDLKWSCVLWNPQQTERWTSETCLTPMYYMCQSNAIPVEKKINPRKSRRKPNNLSDIPILFKIFTYCADTMPFQFDRKATERLIILYEQHPNLYDITSTNYKNKVMRTESYREIAADMKKELNIHVTYHDINKEIKNLRTQYFVETNKIKKSEVSGASTSNIYRPSWWCYKELSFLAGSAPERRSESNFDDGMNIEDDEENTELLYEGPVDEINVDLEMENESRTSTPSTSTSLRKRKRIDKDDTSTLLASAVSALNSQTNEPVDSLEAFGQMVTSEMRRLKDVKETNFLKLKILNLIYEEINKEL
ncbi:Alcohol dehydrogenase transcription factor Myb/SANT-like [Popillia japonica]|uniref:Alcohol dehydrogenase transcription factor Myb/SANT-like n=1 Tax=Popillia japonica TaxID=7064 RepID=A0AAW1LWQ6_POPJA